MVLYDGSLVSLNALLRLDRADTSCPVLTCISWNGEVKCISCPRVWFDSSIQVATLCMMPFSMREWNQKKSPGR